MEYSVAYRTAFQALAHRMRFMDQLSPAVAIAHWQAVVDELRSDPLRRPWELENDLDVAREPLATFLMADELQCLPEHTFFTQCIRALDAEFIALTVEGPQGKREMPDFRWWQDRIPAAWAQPESTE